MNETGDDERFAVPGTESHESEKTPSPDELGTEDRPVPPASEPKQPAPARGLRERWAAAISGFRRSRSR